MNLGLKGISSVVFSLTLSAGLSAAPRLGLFDDRAPHGNGPYWHNRGKSDCAGI